MMNNGLPSEVKKNGRSLDECFADKPHLRQRLLEIADMIDTLVAQGCTADEAEAKAIAEIRKLGHGILTEWAEKAQAAAVAKASQQDPKLQAYGKKTPDLALDLWRDKGVGATLEAGAPWGTSAALLCAGAN